jgi:hypothetical protein
LADQVFEPAMQAQTDLATVFGPLVGGGPGAGMAVMFLGTWLLGTLISLAGYLWRPLRELDTDLPDFDEEHRDRSA